MRNYTRLENKRIRNPAQRKTLIQPQVCDDKLAARHGFQVLQGAQRVPFLQTYQKIIYSKEEDTVSATCDTIIFLQSLRIGKLIKCQRMCHKGSGSVAEPEES